jgi:hypothetical protein
MSVPADARCWSGNVTRQFSLQSGGKIDPGETTPSAHMRFCGAFVYLRG